MPDKPADAVKCPNCGEIIPEGDQAFCSDECRDDFGSWYETHTE